MNWNNKRKFVVPLLIAALPILACGPLFQSRLLDGGDQAVLGAPFAKFFKEIERLKLRTSTRPAVPPTNHVSHADHSLEADLTDLTNALKQASLLPEKSTPVLAAYKKARLFLKSMDETPPAPEDGDDSLKKSTATQLPVLPEGIPAEFNLYWNASKAWLSKVTNQAVGLWKKILELPTGKRKFKSTWATFMLGKASLQSDPPLAREYFQQVRALAKNGFEDSLGLASSSLGWEAKTHYDEGRFLLALDLYLDQAASGDPTATNSLQWTAAKILALNENALKPYAHHANARRVVTAYVLDERSSFHEREPDAPVSPAVRWLRAVEAADVRDVEAAEQLAVAAYRCGQVDQARRWLKVSRETPVSQWLQAKLLLMEGKLEDSAKLLARTAKFFPLAPYPSGTAGPLPFKDSLFFEDGAGDDRTAAQQLWGELGTLRLARKEFTESLDALLRAGFWDDSAYVAERVLTIDELKSFVDQGWPGEVDLNPRGADRHPPLKDYAESLAKTRDRLKHLLARRLARNNRGKEARAYYPSQWLADFDSLMTNLEAAENVSLESRSRSQSYMKAARIARFKGLELLGTELGPDFAVYEGNFEGNISPAERIRGARFGDDSERPGHENKVLFASEEEIRRTSEEPADPPQRFHYRFVAAELGWQAALLLPDQTEEKARILCEAGSWIKYRNPQAADRFYKELVRKCRRTRIGELADAIRWFPLLDEAGNLKEQQPKPTQQQTDPQQLPEATDPATPPADEAPDELPDPN